MLLLAVLLLGGVAAANITLHGQSRQHEVTRVHLNELNMLLHEESALQWKTLADQNAPVRVARELGAIRGRERAILDTLGRKLDGPVRDDLQKQVTDYHAVLDQELGLLGVGKTDEALALEQRETDPRFARLNRTLQGHESLAVTSADQANNFADLALAVAIAFAVAAIGFLLYRFEREHRATNRANEEMLAQQRIAIDALAEHEALIRHQASHDPLTGLPNRRLLSELLEGVGKQMSLLLVDLDNFKPVNDRLGHAAGDELLVAVANRLLTIVRADDTVVRLGGDEFAVVLADSDNAIASRVAERIVAVVGEPFDVDGTVVRVGASVGVALHDDACDGALLLRRADMAMYQVKQESKGGYAIYRTGDNAEAIARQRAIETDMIRR